VKEKIKVERQEIGIVFKGSLLLLAFMCGIMTGKAVEEKKAGGEDKTVSEAEIQPENLLASWVEGIEVYFDSWKDGEVNVIVNNQQGSKLQEVSIVNMEIDGIKVDTYSDLTGIDPGEIRRCTVSYDGEALTGQAEPGQIKGELYVRGSTSYIYQKILIVL